MRCLRRHYLCGVVNLILAAGLLGCGSDDSSVVVQAPSVDPTPPPLESTSTTLTFNGATTQSFQGTTGLMEFNLAVLSQLNPIQPLIGVSADELTFMVTSVTNIAGMTLPFQISLMPASIINPASSLPDQPVHLSLLMDGSGSLFESDPQELRFEAAFGLVNQYRSNPLDFGAVLRFDNQDTGFGVTARGIPLQTAQLLQDFTADQFDLERGVLAATPGGDTALFDATVEAGQLLSDFSPADGINRRVVVFTDGVDNDSEFSLTQAIQALQALPNGSGTSLPVYVVGLGPAVEVFDLQQLALATQGTFVYALFPQQLGTAFRNLFPAAIGEQRVQLAVSSNQALPVGEYLLDGQITFSRGEDQVTTSFVDAALVVR